MNIIRFYQQAINFFYRHPKGVLKTVKRHGGYFNYRNMILMSKRMESYSLELPPVQCHQKGLTIYFLTGQKYLYQTLFCIQSLVKQSKEEFKFVLVDDGSFNIKLINRIKKQLPGAEIIDKKTVERNLNKYLPKNLYPHLHRKREEYPHIKKLTDIHTIPGNSWKLVLDSDMLFWREPKEIIDWLRKPNNPLHMVDCLESYGYSCQLMENLCKSAIPKLLNVGAIGLNSEKINWHNIESWVEILEEKEGKTYYLEQALSAMVIGSQPSKVLDPVEYIVNPSEEKITTTIGTLHHYVDLSKEGYYKYGMSKII